MGYAPLIQAYVSFLSAKLNFHKTHENFKANFDYEEYVSLKGVDDPNEGYESIFDLLMLLDKIDNLQKIIFSYLRPAANNECRISALVPLIEESYNIYKFLQSMLMAMHKSKKSVQQMY
ncbi:ANTH-domain-containing protein [Neocallimastix californiae]|uniref:ANTH-domain-containing protein n=1 Tax=Neocallimastix californiae TaxID=1754190 RepID=A0A1Y2EYS3_9FUNG|nr:ANTH-domain-containing protein [Neocallimastix californiae]|eukprot:ORY76748.1 ANTH-domain-containing protein [Neocallimastix californiae]